MPSNPIALPEIRYIEEVLQADREAIFTMLNDHNQRNGPPPSYRPFALLLRSAEDKTIGGLYGRTSYDWLFIEALVVPEQLRHLRLGHTLMDQAEAIARQRNCVGIWLDTFSFQALGFYQKLGFTEFGRLEDRPRGYTHHFMQKRL